MESKRKAKFIALTISIIYVGIGSIKLISIINSDGMVFHSMGETFEWLISPSFLLGFTLGFGGGIGFALIGQLITFALMFGILYVVYLPITRLDERRSSKNQKLKTEDLDSEKNGN